MSAHRDLIISKDRCPIDLSALLNSIQKLHIRCSPFYTTRYYVKKENSTRVCLNLLFLLEHDDVFNLYELGFTLLLTGNEYNIFFIFSIQQIL